MGDLASILTNNVEDAGSMIQDTNYLKRKETAPQKAQSPYCLLFSEIPGHVNEKLCICRSSI